MTNVRLAAAARTFTLLHAVEDFLYHIFWAAEPVDANRRWQRQKGVLRQAKRQ